MCLCAENINNIFILSARQQITRFVQKAFSVILLRDSCFVSQPRTTATYSIIATKHSQGNWHGDGFTREAGCHHQRQGEKALENMLIEMELFCLNPVDCGLGSPCSPHVHYGGD